MFNDTTPLAQHVNTAQLEDTFVAFALNWVGMAPIAAEQHADHAVLTPPAKKLRIEPTPPRLTHYPVQRSFHAEAQPCCSARAVCGSQWR